ncbi:hypothetical protein QMA04_04530 [Planococcus sp. APC 3900]|uniref:hypothetical protein n=1 Tax=Planococcus sp. APC 3900 TaxID=3035191 RepID=UPI0025B3E1DD|nr:hypothetical protein [Planococcus sp. APC 3900]MDN3437344.1 hypothetical protein [Planococcus sp. APC 3900]
MNGSSKVAEKEVDRMWALITGGFIFVLAVVFSLGKASSKRENVANSHRQELLSRGKESIQEATLVIEEAESQKNHKERKVPHPSEQL